MLHNDPGHRIDQNCRDPDRNFIHIYTKISFDLSARYFFLSPDGTLFHWIHSGALQIKTYLFSSFPGGRNFGQIVGNVLLKFRLNGFEIKADKKVFST